ncbi:MAG: signal peptide peptidase SppA [Deltaproteobacteria bacterium]|nr:MAG: signal peptide peptidase SppA [Deltaproteobacteria bacterium]
MARKRRKWWIVLALLILVAAVAVWSRRSVPKVEPGSFVVVDLAGSFPEGPPKGRVARLLEDRNMFVELLDDLDAAARDERVAGVLLRVGPIGMGWARARELRDALAGLRDGGKRVVAYIDTELLGGNKEYFVASAAQRIVLSPAATFMLNGLSAHFYFLGDLWTHLDIEMEVEQIREYKTFGDMLARSEMTPAHREMANSLLDDLEERLEATVAQARGMSKSDVAAVIESCPSEPDEFVEAGLADGVAFYDELLEQLGGGTAVPVIERRDYHRAASRRLSRRGGAQVAVVEIVGTLVGGKGGKRSILGMTVGSRTIAEAIEQATDDDSIRAIVVRIDSPGGSARAADEIWRALRQAASKKPVVASLGDVAASGGYYVAAGADVIVAEPGTLTGSIGVVLFKPNVSGLLERLGIHTETVARGRYSRIMDVTKSFDDAERALVRDQMEGVYQRFLDRVAQGRGKTVEEVDRLGGGRVWTGAQAVANGLVDEAGGLRDAIRRAATEAGIEDPSRVRVVYLPKAGGILEQLLDLRTGNVEVASLLGLPAEAVRSILEPPQGLLAVLPATISID